MMLWRTISSALRYPMVKVEHCGQLFCPFPKLVSVIKLILCTTQSVKIGNCVPF